MIDGPEITITSSMSKNGVIGYEGKIPWKHEDWEIRRLLNLVFRKTVIVGRKTDESMWSYRSLIPKICARYIVLSRNGYTSPFSDAEVFSSLDQVLSSIQDVREVIVFGGGEIYKLFLPYADMIDLTTFDIEVLGDAYFPTLCRKTWQPINLWVNFADSDHKLGFKVQHIKRISAKRGFVDLWNCRSAEELDFLRAFLERDTCPGCGENKFQLTKGRYQKDWRFWYVANHPFPDSPSPMKEHLIAIYKHPRGLHVESANYIGEDARKELQKLFEWAQYDKKAKRSELILPEGSSTCIGSSIKHLHSEFVLFKDVPSAQ